MSRCLLVERCSSFIYWCPFCRSSSLGLLVHGSGKRISCSWGRNFFDCSSEELFTLWKLKCDQISCKFSLFDENNPETEYENHSQHGWEFSILVRGGVLLSHLENFPGIAGYNVLKVSSCDRSVIRAYFQWIVSYRAWQSFLHCHCEILGRLPRRVTQDALFKHFDCQVEKRQLADVSLKFAATGKFTSVFQFWHLSQMNRRRLSKVSVVIYLSTYI